MDQYFSGRRQVGEQQEISLDSGKSKVQCTIFERWKEIGSYNVRCGRRDGFELNATVGIGKKSSQTLESTIASSIGAAGLAQIKSQIKGTLSQEINWEKSFSTKLTYACEAPECGYYLLAVHQLVREYELAHFRRGSWPFRSDVWDWKWDEVLQEDLEKYDALQDVSEYDERCKCPPKDSPDYDGRLSCALGDLTLRAPYKLNPKGFQMRIGKFVVSFDYMNYAAGLRAIEQGFHILIPKDALTEPLISLSGMNRDKVKFAGNHIEAIARKDQVVQPESFGVLPDIVFEPVFTGLTPSSKLNV